MLRLIVQKRGEGFLMISDYENKTDEELIVAIYDESTSDDEKNAITDYLLNKYKNLVKTLAKSMYIIGGDSDDLMQEGMIGLFKAIHDYDPGRDASFYTFARLCIQRQVYTAVEASGRKKHLPLNSSISFDITDSEDGDDMGHLMSDDSPSNNPEAAMIERENLEDIEQMIERELSKFERAVLDLHITGMNYVEIARVLKRDDKSVDNALQRIKSKLKKLRR